MEIGVLKLSRSYLCVLMIIVTLPDPSKEAKVIDARDKTLSRGTDRGTAYARFKPHKFSHLNITSIGSDFVLKGSECGLACVNIPSCFSFNLGLFHDVIGKVICELLPSDIYNNSEKFVFSQSHHHYSIASPCFSWPCQNKGTCAAQYAENSYLCVCAEGFKGKHCELDIDECAEGLHTCDKNAYCNNTAGSYMCACKPAYHGDRENCMLPIKSVILQKNATYLDDLARFLIPTLGDHSKWVLCYRASSHGWSASTFHTRCDGKRDTISIIKVGQYLFGGYTDISWESSGSYTNTSKAFIFSLVNKEGLPPLKSLVRYPNWAIVRLFNLGVTFGGGHDICIKDNASSNTHSYTNFGSSYAVPSGVRVRTTILAGTYHFKPDEVEVFYLD